ncbi:hypothetical protein NIES2098_26710 [Calothrix sp. NIES-2098]|nr:hypothetical protein NIES2098_26710 [Calothrix sp. NIES-2098]
MSLKKLMFSDEVRYLVSKKIIMGAAFPRYFEKNFYIGFNISLSKYLKKKQQIRYLIHQAKICYCPNLVKEEL